MTTSGITTFNANRDQIIRSSLRKIGAFAAGETPDDQTVQDCAFQLNTMVKAWMASGLHVWTETEATLFLQVAQRSYTLGGNTTDHCTESYAATTALLPANAGATSITVASPIGFGSGYYVGVVLNSGSMQWTTQSGAAFGSIITLADALTDGIAAGSAVYVYQTNIVRPLRVIAARRFNYQSQITTDLGNMTARLDFRALPNQTSTGVINQAFYDPRGGANTQGVLWVWPPPNDVTFACTFTWWRPIQDFLTAATTPDLPQEWLDCLVWNLAAKMAPEYDVPPQRYEILKMEAKESLDLAAGFDREPESYLFGFNADQTQP